MPEPLQTDGRSAQCRVVVVWIDWYAYHLARFDGLLSAFGRNGEVVGIEWVGGVGVHAGMKFREERSAALPVETLMPTESWRSADKLALARMTWARLSRLRPQMVLVPGYYTLPAIATALWARTHGATSVLMSESTAFDHPRTGWKEWLKAKTLRALFSWAVVGGRAHRRYLAQLSFPPERIRGCYDVVGNDLLRTGAAHLRRTSSAARHGLPSEFFLFVGRMADEKNVGGLLRAWLSYRESGGQWSLVLAGDGPALPSLRHILTGSRFAKDVIFAGHKGSQELLPFYAFAACFVLPSTREPWGLVVNEAMATELPVIVSTRCGCAEDLVEDGDNGFLFNPADPAALTRCLAVMASLDAEQRDRMGLSSASRIAAFSPESFGREVATIADASLLPTAASQQAMERAA